MSLFRLALLRHLATTKTLTQTLTPLIHHRTFAFSSAEEAAAERRRRKRRLRIEPPLHALRRENYPSRLQRDPNAPRLPDSTSALVGPRLNLHNRVQSLIRASDLDAASAVARHAVFSNTRPTVFTCNAIIAAMYRAKRYGDAVALFHYFFRQSDIVPNVVSYNNLINTYCDEGEVDKGLEVYREILATAPFSPSPITYKHLTKGLIEAGRIGEAVDLLREMLNKGQGADSLVYNNLILGFLEMGNLEKANELFDELKERCLVYDGVVNATFMDWFFRQGREKEAMESYRSLLDRNFTMVPATCNVLLECLLKHGKKSEAWKLFESMLDNHTPPRFQAVNSDTFNIMVNECFKEGKTSEALETFRKVGTKAGSKPFAMDVAGYNNMITRLCEHGMISEAENIFKELCSKSLTPDVNTYRTLIDAHLKLEQIDEALQYFSRMVEGGLRVVASFGNRVFDVLLKNGKALDCAQILTKMGEKDPKPDFTCYDVVIRGLCNDNQLDASLDLVDQMMRYGVGVAPALKEFLTEAFSKAGRDEEIDRVLNMSRWGYAPPSRMAGPPPPRMAAPPIRNMGGYRPPSAGRWQPYGTSAIGGSLGVRPPLDGVLNNLPCPIEVNSYALDQTKEEEKVTLSGSPDGPLVALAFKLEEGRFGRLTYLRINEGVIRKGDFIINVNTGKKVKVPRLVRMHANEMEDIQEAHAGQIVAVFGVDCASGDTFTDGSVKYTMTSMNVPEPVMSLAVQPVSKGSGGQFSKALNRFQKEDPTFRVGLDPESGQTIISGMGELHLDIYVERIRREYKVDATVGKPRVNFRETITQRANFDYLHEKQSGGQGQYGRVIGFVEPLPLGSATKFEFENHIVGQAIPSNFIPAIEKGFKEAANSGSLIGHPVENLRVILTDGASNAVDSSELAFKLASMYAFRQCYAAAKPVILEPVMVVELKVPTEFQGSVAGDINKRKGVIVGNDQDGDDSIITAHVPLNNMFGYSTALQSMTQGKGEFTMEYKEHSPVSQDVQMQLINTYKASKGTE